MSQVRIRAQTDPIDIRAALERCWTVTSTYTDPITDPVRGIAGLVAVIVEFRIRFPGAAISPTSPLDRISAYLAPAFPLAHPLAGLASAS